jgi:hypothetical protein
MPLIVAGPHASRQSIDAGAQGGSQIGHRRRVGESIGGPVHPAESPTGEPGAANGSCPLISTVGEPRNDSR